MKRRNSKPNLWLPVAAPILVVCAWELAVRLNVLPPSLAAAPSAIGHNLASLLLSGELLTHLGYSLLRIVISVAVAAAFGLASGILLWEWRLLDELLSPTLRFLAPVPVVVWMPFVIAFVGAGEAYKLVLAAIAGFLIIHIHTFEGVGSLDREYVELADIYGLTLAERVRHIYLPAAAPNIFVGLRLTLAIAWIVLFFVEFGSATQGAEGLGWYIADARALGRVEDEYAGVALLGAAGYSTDWLAAKFQAHVLRWTDSGFITDGVSWSDESAERHR